MGGEPTFVSIDDMDGAEWNYTALSATQARARRPTCCYRLRKRVRARRRCCTSARASGIPASRCRAGRCRASGARTACRCGTTKPTRRCRPKGVTATRGGRARASPRARAGARRLARIRDARLRGSVAHPPRRSEPAGQRRPARRGHFDGARARARLREQLAGGLGKPVGYVLPLQAPSRARKARGTDASGKARRWPLRRETRVPGRGRFADGLSPAARLAARSAAGGRGDRTSPTDPFERRDALGKRKPSKAATAAKHAQVHQRRARRRARSGEDRAHASRRARAGSTSSCRP